MACGSTVFVCEKHRLRDTTETAPIADSAMKGSLNRNISPYFQQDTWKENSSPTLIFTQMTILNGMKKLPCCRVLTPTGPVCLSNDLQVVGGAQLGRDLRVCGRRHRGCWGSCGWVLGCPLRSRKNSSSQTGTGTEKSLRVDALHAQPGSRAGLALTAGIRAHSYWLSFFPDASLSGHCSPPALRFCPVRSGAGNKEERQLWGSGFLQT